MAPIQPTDLGRPFAALAIHFECAGLDADLRAVQSHGVARERDIELDDARGLLRIHPLRADDPGTRGVAISLIVRPTDSAASALQDPIEARERAELALQQFAYAVSHDLREPLRTVTGYTRLLAERYQGALDANADEFIHFTQDSVKRMTRLIDDLLVYSRIHTQGRPPSLVDSTIALDRAVVDVRADLDAAGGTLEVEPLPELHVDHEQLRQVFRALLDNAIKFRADRPLAIGVRARRLDDRWRFEVSDNGIGIESHHQERIFQIFQRLHGRDAYPGTGIGLAICKRIMERHHGVVDVCSRPGVGTTIAFTLPRGETSEA